MEYVSPCQTDNAIKVFALAFEFAEHIQEHIVRESIKIHQNDQELQKELPRTQLHDSVTLQMGNSENPISKTGVNGVTFDCLTPRGDQEWAIVIRRDAFIVTCSQYTRWTEFYSRANKYFIKLLPALGNTKVRSLGIECVDEFDILQPENPDWKNQLFKLESNFLPRNIFDLNDSWHSFHGFFEKSGNKSIKSKILNNVDVNYNYQPETKSLLNIKGRHTTHLEEAQDMKSLIETDLSSDFFNISHDKNKDVMRCLLSNEMLKEISLGD